MGKSRRRKRGENPWQKENDRNDKKKKKTQDENYKESKKPREWKGFIKKTEVKRNNFFEKNYRLPNKSVKEIMEEEEVEE